jgi:hypothetical protein
MQNHKFFFLAVIVFLLALSFGGVIYAATSATIAFLDTSDQPMYEATGTGLVDDDGCDIVTMLMTDATGGIVDVDTFCLDLGTGIGDDFTDWGSHESGYVPGTGPITYTLYDTAFDDICDNDENSSACSDYLASGAVPCIAEAYYQPPSLPVGTALVICGGGAVAGVTGCTLNIPSGSVVGEAPLGAQAYYAPGSEAAGVVLNPGTYIVIGQDESETYYKVVLACQTLWVLKSSMQPSFEAPQNGAPLPTRIVS